MTQVYLEFHPVTFRARIAAAALTLFAVPIASALILFLIALWEEAVGYVGLLRNDILVISLGGAIASPVVAWAGFLILLPFTHRVSAELFIRNGFVTVGIGFVVGALIWLLFLAGVALFGDVPITSEELFILFYAGCFGGVYSAAYWLILRRFFVKRLPDVKDVFV